jgi:hypothetical protein
VGLRELGVKYSSDKLYWHSYFNDNMYPKLFEGMQVRRLLEIGIGYESLMKPFLPEGIPFVHGSSLRIWEEFFPEAQIFACDIREDTLINEGRIRSMVCDQSSAFDLGCLCGLFGFIYDVIIDDGSHQFEHQRFTATLLLQYLRPSLYVIEDIWADKGQALADEFGGELWRGEKGRDDNLVIIKR